MRRFLAAFSSAAVTAGVWLVVGVPDAAYAAPTVYEVNVGGAPLTAEVGLKGAQVVFAATEGQTLSVVAADGSFVDPCDLTLVVRNPRGVKITAPACAGDELDAAPVKAASTGLYRLDLTPATGASGTVTVSIEGTASQTGDLPITPNAGRLPVSVPAGSSRDVVFPGKAGTYVRADIAGASGGTVTADLLVDGVSAAPATVSGDRILLGRPVLAADTTARLRITNTGTEDLPLTAAVVSGVDSTKAMKVAGPTETEIVRPAQQATLTFTPKPSAAPYLWVRTPAAMKGVGMTLLGAGSTWSATVPAGVRYVALPESRATEGTWSVVLQGVDPDAVGSVSLSVGYQAVFTKPATLGSATTATFPTPELARAYTFTGVKGKKVDLDVSAIDLVAAAGGSAGVTADVRSSTGAVVMRLGTIAAVKRVVSGSKLPASGTYTLRLYTAGAATGSASFSLNLA